MVNAKVFKDEVKKLIEKIYETQAANIDATAEIMTNAIKKGGVIHIYGSGHSVGLGIDITDRPGCLVPIHIMEMTDFVYYGGVSVEEFTDKVNKGLKPSERVTKDDWYKPIAPDDKTTLNDLVWAAVDKFAEKNPVTKEQRYTLAGHAYEVATRSRKPVHTKSGMLSSLRAFSKKQYAEESGQDLTASVGDDELATVFKNFEGI